MARTERRFDACSEMRKMAEDLIGVLYPWIGSIDPDLIRFDTISSEQAKNSSDTFVDELTKDWLKQETPRRWVVAIYQDKWDEWDTTRRQWELFECLLKVAKIKPDLIGYRFMHDGLRHILKENMPEIDWRRSNNAGINLPNLLSDSTVKLLPRYEEYESENQLAEDEKETKVPVPKSLR
jgi:hypothetical protein